MKFKILTAILLALLLAAFVAGCAGNTADGSPSPSDASMPSDEASAPSNSDLIAVTDMTGREITLQKPAEKIVALTAADCEILYALGAGETLTGRGEFCDYPAEVLDKPAVESGSETNIEQIIALGPEVVLMSTMAQTVEHIDSLEAAGITVAVTDAHDIAGVYEAIKLIGAVTGKNDEADGIISGMEDTFDEIRRSASDGGGKTVYFEVSPLQYGLYTAGSGTFMNELSAMLGLENIFSDMEEWKQVSEEQVIDRNPDYIVTTAMSYEGSPDPVEEINNRQGWESITAVKNRDILNDYSNSMIRPGPRLAEGARQLYDFVYGE